MRYEIVIDHDLDEIPEITLRATFGAATATAGQTVTLAAVRPGRGGRTIASGLTVAGTFHSVGAACSARQCMTTHFSLMRSVSCGWRTTAPGFFRGRQGEAVNFFGPDGNALAIIVEIPTVELARFNRSADHSGVDADNDAKDQQVDRSGQPFLNQFAIPPLPLNDKTQTDHRTAFNLGSPISDFRKFRDDVVTVLTGFWGNPPDRAGALVDRFLLGNVITFDTSLTWEPEGGGFPNGRRLRDDVADFMLDMFSGGRMPGDNVSDDNGDRITDGSQRPDGTSRPAAFPYIGAPN